MFKNKFNTFHVKLNNLTYLSKLTSERKKNDHRLLIISEAKTSNAIISEWPKAVKALLALGRRYIEDNIQSTMRLFADDSTLYREIQRPEDHKILKDDLQQLSRWSLNWMMDFNVKKCDILTITRKRTPSIREYHLSNGLIPRVKENKYLGVTVSADIRWKKHCQTIRHKASRNLEFLHRTFSPCTRILKSRAYTALVRPQLEYVSEA